MYYFSSAIMEPTHLGPKEVVGPHSECSLSVTYIHTLIGTATPTQLLNSGRGEELFPDGQLKTPSGTHATPTTLGGHDLLLFFFVVYARWGTRAGQEMVMVGMMQGCGGRGWRGCG